MTGTVVGPDPRSRHRRLAGRLRGTHRVEAELVLLEAGSGGAAAG